MTEAIEMTPPERPEPPRVDWPPERTIDRIWPVGEPADVRVVALRDEQIHVARALVLAARLDRLDLGHHLGRYLLGPHRVGVVVVVGDAHRSR
ncbi:MAG TPA: hypothetical protein VF516_28730 [Kofleriaceae bacterium]